MSVPGRPAAAARFRRAIDGILLLDKPRGLSSNQALQRVKRCLSAAKAGHAGTLDPLATGMLPLCFGQATKTCGPLLGASKAYRVRLALGTATTTGDCEGEVTHRHASPTLDRAAVAAVLRGLEGEHEQVPPMYSALKHRGRPLYELARAGETVQRLPRPIRIARLELLDCGVDHVDFDVECSKGTYVRVLGEDIARRLGTVGHLESLRRLWVEPFAGEPMVTLDAIESWVLAGDPGTERPPWLLAVDRALEVFPGIALDATAATALRCGQTVAIGAEPGVFRAYGPHAEFLGLIDVDVNGVARVRRLFVGPPPRDAA